MINISSISMYNIYIHTYRYIFIYIHMYMYISMKHMRCSTCKVICLGSPPHQQEFAALCRVVAQTYGELAEGDVENP